LVCCVGLTIFLLYRALRCIFLLFVRQLIFFQGKDVVVVFLLVFLLLF